MPTDPSNPSEKRVTTIGGVFFRCNDPAALKSWYSTHLGLQTDEWGTNFQWRHVDDPSRVGSTQWSPFPADSDYFPRGQPMMINYRVENLQRLVEQLRAEGVTIVDEIKPETYGKFCHILDPEGNHIELWEPDDAEYKKVVQGVTK